MYKYTVTVNSEEFLVELVSRTNSQLQLKIEGELYEVDIKSVLEFQAPQTTSTPAAKTKIDQARTLSANDQFVRSPITGRISSISVHVGAEVVPGQTVAVIEAMKMENNITSQRAGVVKTLLVVVGAEIRMGDPLIEIS